MNVQTGYDFMVFELDSLSFAQPDQQGFLSRMTRIMANNAYKNYELILSKDIISHE
jgi:hypothetical protein